MGCAFVTRAGVASIANAAMKAPMKQCVYGLQQCGKPVNHGKPWYTMVNHGRPYLINLYWIWFIVGFTTWYAALYHALTNQDACIEGDMKWLKGGVLFILLAIERSRDSQIQWPAMTSCQCQAISPHPKQLHPLARRSVPCRCRQWLRNKELGKHKVS